VTQLKKQHEMATLKWQNGMATCDDNNDMEWQNKMKTL
jgi:hypothetical protein